MMKQSGPRGIAPAGGRAAQPARRRTAASASLSGNGSQISPGVFRIKQLVGQGSFGEVFEVRHSAATLARRLKVDAALRNFEWPFGPVRSGES